MARAVRPLINRLPPLQGRPIRLHALRGLRDRRGAVHGGSFLRERRIAFDCAAGEFPRIFMHELFHFVWVRAGNPLRFSYEEILRAEWALRRRGELGWSAEWRKDLLRAPDLRLRTRRWREYCCESFCDTAGWMYSGVRRHPEFTLSAGLQQARRDWFHAAFDGRRLSI